MRTTLHSFCRARSPREQLLRDFVKFPEAFLLRNMSLEAARDLDMIGGIVVKERLLRFDLRGFLIHVVELVL